MLYVVFRCEPSQPAMTAEADSAALTERWAAAAAASDQPPLNPTHHQLAVATVPALMAVSVPTPFDRPRHPLLLRRRPLLLLLPTHSRRAIN